MYVYTPPSKSPREPLDGDEEIIALCFTGTKLPVRSALLVLKYLLYQY